jgi:hypothetical protein
MHRTVSISILRVLQARFGSLASFQIATADAKKRPVPWKKVLRKPDKYLPMGILLGLSSGVSFGVDFFQVSGADVGVDLGCY